MGEHHIAKEPGVFLVSTKMKTFYSVCMFLGLMAFIFTVIKNPNRAWHAYMLGLFYFTTVSVGGLFFTALQHTTKAGWSVNIRRVPEAFSDFLKVAALLALIFMVAGSGYLYEWLHGSEVAKDHLLAHKQGYLNQTFFWVRWVVFFGGWVWFAKVMVGRSLKQDKSGDESLTHKNLPLSVIFIIFFALSYSFFSVDSLMSIEAHWFSTIFGIYTFAGLFQSTMAFAILFILYMIKKGYLKGFVTMDHVHDLGKFLFAFTVFWAYIAFSQYMLIWYANLPEESFYYIARSQAPWVYVSIALILFKFVVPFFALLPRWAKRTPNHLVAVSILILVMQFVDIFWLVYPNISKDEIVFGIPEIFVFFGFLGAFLFVVTRFLSKNNLVPLKDPRRAESMHHHVVY